MEINRHMSSNQVIGLVEYFILEFFFNYLIKVLLHFLPKRAVVIYLNQNPFLIGTGSCLLHR